MVVATYDFRVDWNADNDFTDTGEDVTTRVLAREGVTISYGRDQARSLSPIAPGQATFLLDNTSRDYSPENSSSPLAGNVLTGRPVRIQATHNAVTYTLFRGHIDDLQLLPARADRSMQMSCLDALGKLREATISTELHFCVTTGQAIGLILDAVGWPTADRDLDVGATTVRWWWEEGADAFAAVERLVNSEGLPAMVTVDSDGKFVFRDRHHRTRAVTGAGSGAGWGTSGWGTTGWGGSAGASVVTFRDTGAEPLFSAPLVYDAGWRDIVNSVVLSVDERDPADAREMVWSSDRSYSLSDGETLLLRAEGSEPFTGAVEPVEGVDFMVRSGAVTVTLSRTSGQAATLFLKASGTSVVDSMQLRAFPVPVRRTMQVQVEDSTSITRYGRRSYTQDAPWAGVTDAESIAAVLLAYRAERLPIVSFRVVNGDDTRLVQQLALNLSDLITVVDAETGLSDDFYVERIEHTISEAGRYHETVFGCEKAPTQPSNVFIFDVSQFNVGVFGTEGLNDPAAVFIFDHASQGRFDVGRFAW